MIRPGLVAMLILMASLPLLAAGKMPAQVGSGVLRQWLAFLSSDEMKGRDNGSEEIERAASWLAETFKEIGLQPAPGLSDYFQGYEIKTEQGGFPAKNVIGYLEGDDPKLKEEYIVLSAHYDHVGVNPELEGDQILNGADDDASGVINIMGIAASLIKLQKEAGSPKLKRSLLVIAFSGEEMRLLGSRHYAKHPLLPHEKMLTNLNFEMVGHSRKTGKNRFFMTGAQYSELNPLVKALAAEYSWELIDNPFKEMKLFFRSDNVSFAMLEYNREERTALGIPAHSFSTWGGEDHYHQPHDEADSIDYDNLAGFVQMMAGVVRALCERTEPIQWLENEEFTFRRP